MRERREAAGYVVEITGGAVGARINNTRTANAITHPTYVAGERGDAWRE